MSDALGLNVSIEPQRRGRRAAHRVQETSSSWKRCCGGWNGRDVHFGSGSTADPERATALSPLHPNKQTLLGTDPRSALGHIRTSLPVFRRAAPWMIAGIHRSVLDRRASISCDWREPSSAGLLLVARQRPVQQHRIFDLPRDFLGRWHHPTTASPRAATTGAARDHWAARPCSAARRRAS